MYVRNRQQIRDQHKISVENNLKMAKNKNMNKYVKCQLKKNQTDEFWSGRRVRKRLTNVKKLLVFLVLFSLHDLLILLSIFKILDGNFKSRPSNSRGKTLLARQKRHSETFLLPN